MLPFRQMPPETLSSVLWDRSSKEPFNPKFNETTDIWAYVMVHAGPPLTEDTNGARDLPPEMGTGVG